MDFKVTGTREGICGVQMDIKVDGLSMDVMRKALDQAKKGRMHILDAMHKCVEAPREDVKPHAPRMVKLFIDKEFIGAVIGPGGKVIQEIQRETGATINIEEVGNQGEVSIFSKEKTSLDKAVAWINGITAIPEIGETYEGTVKGIKEFGAFVEFLPKKEGLLHISEISWKRLESMEGIFREGDKVKVKLLDVDPRTGKFKLSRKALMPKPEGHDSQSRGGGERRPHDNRPRQEGRPQENRPVKGNNDEASQETSGDQ
jgi:polyribonucleotide nucleotidyltransferase